MRLSRARDLMQDHVVSVSPETSLLDVHRLFTEEQISAAPVVDDAEEVVGVITSADLIRSLEEERDTAVVQTSYQREVVPYSSPDWDGVPEDFQDRLAQLRVSDAMTEGVVSVRPDASAAEVAETLRKNRLHHVFVIEDGELRGVVSTYDLLQLVERMRET
jgi:CBS domain-containing protein